MRIGATILRWTVLGVALIASLFSVRLGQWMESWAPQEPLPQFPVVAPLASDEDLLWLARAQEDRLAQLKTARTAAKDWATTITAVTGAVGIVALIKGPEEIGRLTREWELAVGAALLVAVLLALRGIVLAAVAAQGTPTSFVYTAAGYQDHYFHELDTTATALRVSRITVVLGTLALVVAIGMTWYGEEEKKAATNVFVVPSSGSSLCGELSATAGGILRLKDSEGDIHRVDPQQLVAIVPAAKCPELTG